MRRRAALILAAILAACKAQPSNPGNETDKAKVIIPAPESIVSPEFGKRRPNTRMTSRNMPFFDTVTYCVPATLGTDTMVKGPAYEACIEHQDHTRVEIADAIDANKFDEADIVRCAKGSRTAYVGMWYCMNGRPYAE